MEQAQTTARLNRSLILAVCFSFALLSVLAVANVLLGNLNQDEGWYLYAALETTRGKLPYRDFFFTQGPIQPLVYGWLSPLWCQFGVAGGRFLSAILGLSGSLFAALMSARILPYGRKIAGALLVLLLTAGSVYHSYFTSITKTYALALFLLMAGFWALSCIEKSPAFFSALSAVFMALAAGTRISLVAILAVVGVWLISRHRQFKNGWLWFGISGVVTLAFIYGPFLIYDYEAFKFANTFHVGRSNGGLLFKAGSLSRLVRGYFPLICLAAILLPIGLADITRHERKRAMPLSWPILWVAAFSVVFVIHLLSPFPYDDYQVPIMPLLASATAVGLLTCRPLCRLSPRVIIWPILFMVGLSAFSSPINQEWFFIRQDRFWPVIKAEPDLAKLRHIGRQIKTIVPEGELLLTPDTYLAVEAGRQVPEGFEMGPFTYFPDLSNASARLYHLFNRDLFKQALQNSDAPLAAFSGYAFSMAAPSMRKLNDDEQMAFWEIIKQRYTPLESNGVFQNFGQNHTELTLWTLQVKAMDHK